MNSIHENHSLQSFLNQVSHLPWFENVTCDNLNIKSQNGDSLLHSAAIIGDLDAIDILVSRGLNINQKGSDGYTPLHESAAQGNMGAYNQILKLGADKSIKNDSGFLAEELLGFMRE